MRPTVMVQQLAWRSGPYSAPIGWITKVTVRDGRTRWFWALSADRSRAKAQAWIDSVIYP